MLDGHCHLDPSIGSCAKAMDQLYHEALESCVEGIVLLNIPGPGFGDTIGFDNEEVIDSVADKVVKMMEVFPIFA